MIPASFRNARSEVQSYVCARFSCAVSMHGESRRNDLASNWSGCDPRKTNMRMGGQEALAPRTFRRKGTSLEAGRL